MKTVHKYLLGDGRGRFTIAIPKDAQVVDFAMCPYTRTFAVWAFVTNPYNGRPADRTFQIVWTGDVVPDNAKYVGIARVDDLVWHCFEV